MSADGKRVLLIVASMDFRDEEYLETRKVLESAGAIITTASSRAGESTGTMGSKITVDKGLSEVGSGSFDAVVFIGGPGAKEFFDDTRAHKLALEAVNQGKVVAAICIAPSILANAGVLNGKKATAFISEKDNMESHGAKYTGNDVTKDGKIITASGPHAAGDFGRLIANKL